MITVKTNTFKMTHRLITTSKTHEMTKKHLKETQSNYNYMGNELREPQASDRLKKASKKHEMSSKKLKMARKRQKELKETQNNLKQT